MPNAVNFFSSQTVSSVLATGVASAAVSAGVLAIGWKIADSISNPNMKKVVKIAIFFFSLATPFAISKSLAIYAIVILAPQAVLLGSLVGAVATAIIMSKKPKLKITPEQKIATLTPEQISNMDKKQLQKYRGFFQTRQDIWFSGLSDDIHKAFCEALYDAFQEELEPVLQGGRTTSLKLKPIIEMDEQALQRSRKFFKENYILSKTLPIHIRVAFNIREVLANPTCETLMDSAAREICDITPEQFRLFEEQYLEIFSEIWDRLSHRIRDIFSICVSSSLTSDEISHMEKDRLQRYLDYFQQKESGKAIWGSFLLPDIREAFHRAFYNAFQDELKQALGGTTSLKQIIKMDNPALERSLGFFKANPLLYEPLPGNVKVAFNIRRVVASPSDKALEDSTAREITLLEEEQFQLFKKQCWDSLVKISRRLPPSIPTALAARVMGP